MLRPTPRSTRTDTSCPYTTLFRSPSASARWTNYERNGRYESCNGLDPKRGHRRFLLWGLAALGGHRLLTFRIMRTGSSSEAFSSIRRTTGTRSEEHTSELQSLMRISYAVFCLKKKTKERTKESL